MEHRRSQIYIMDIDGNLCNIASWNKGSDASGVVLITDKVSIIIAKDEWCSRDDKNTWVGNAVSAWGGRGLYIHGCKAARGFYDDAIKDFDGFSNTDTIIDALSGYDEGYVGASAAKYCKAYFKGYKEVGEWYLPAMGELNEIVMNYKAINVAMRAINGVPLYKNRWVWTSTQYSADRAWLYYWDGEIFHHDDKFHDNGVRPICKLYE